MYNCTKKIKCSLYWVGIANVFVPPHAAGAYPPLALGARKPQNVCYGTFLCYCRSRINHNLALLVMHDHRETTPGVYLRFKFQKYVPNNLLKRWIKKRVSPYLTLAGKSCPTLSPYIPLYQHQHGLILHWKYIFWNYLPTKCFSNLYLV